MNGRANPETLIQDLYNAVNLSEDLLLALVETAKLNCPSAMVIASGPRLIGMVTLELSSEPQRLS